MEQEKETRMVRVKLSFKEVSVKDIALFKALGYEGELDMDKKEIRLQRPVELPKGIEIPNLDLKG